MGGQYGTKETKEALDLVFAGMAGYQKAKEDGKLGFDDVSHFLPAFVAAGPAFDKAALIPKELGELDDADAQDVLQHAATRLPGVLPEDVVRVVNAALKVAVAAAQLVGVLSSHKVVMPVPAVASK